MASPPLLCAEHLTRTFVDAGRGRVAAVQGLSLSVAAGEVADLLGRNGAGKTTTLRMLSTLLPPDKGAGTVSIAGIDALRHPRRARSRLAYVPAEAGLPLGSHRGKWSPSLPSSRASPMPLRRASCRCRGWGPSGMRPRRAATSARA